MVALKKFMSPDLEDDSQNAKKPERGTAEPF